MSDPLPANDATTGDVTDLLVALDVMCRTTIPDLAVLLAPDVDGMVQLLQMLRVAQAQLRWAAEELEDEIAKAMPHKQVDVPGVGMAELKTGAARKGWDKRGLVDVLTARIADDDTVFCDAETGEFFPPHRVTELVLSRFMECATPSWKVTGLRALHIDPDEFCETTWGRKTIVTPKVDPWPSTPIKEET